MLFDGETNSLDCLLAAEWQLAQADAALRITPANSDGLHWQNATVPGTVASTIVAGPVTGGAHYPNLDAYDWVYRCAFSWQKNAREYVLRLHGLAGLAEVWLNGQSLCHTDNMFRHYEMAVSERLQPENTLYIIFRSVDHLLAQKQPRPRWKTRLVDHQNLRFLRRTLLGRMPGWSPSLPAIGPYRPVSLLPLPPLAVINLHTVCEMQGEQGTVRLRATVQSDTKTQWLCRINGENFPLTVTTAAPYAHIDAQLCVTNPVLWWPHTQGEQGSNTLQLIAVTDEGEQVSLEKTLRFRSVRFSTSEAESAFYINGEHIFVRGACWTSADVRTLQSQPQQILALLQHLRMAGMNMLRIGGTMLYEADVLYQLCDTLGIMIWQDFMFANMDYPFDNTDFKENCEVEVTQQLQRLSQFGCVVAYCGGSEIEQQAAMTGFDVSQQLPTFLQYRLPELCEQNHPGTAYFASTPSGGAMPFFTSEGITHYYGVGAYLRDFSDLFVADVKFASECLAFSNMPSAQHLKKHFGSLFPPPHHPQWKASVCRDNAAGWDFDDVRDHYLGLLFGVDAVKLRYQDLERYYALSQVVTGEVMSRVFQFWRSRLSRCSGGLIWNLSDTVAGGGWGIIDSDGDPKPALHIVAQVLQPLQVVLVEKGLEGYWLEVINETGEKIEATLQVDLWQNAKVSVAQASIGVQLSAGEKKGWLVEALLGHFYDSAYAYRFGPEKHQLVSARLLNSKAEILSQATAYCGSAVQPLVAEAQVHADVIYCQGQWQLDVQSTQLLQRVCIALKGFTFTHNYLNLLPNQRYQIPLQRVDDKAHFRGTLSAINSAQVFVVRLRT